MADHRAREDCGQGGLKGRLPAMGFIRLYKARCLEKKGRLGRNVTDPHSLSKRVRASMKKDLGRLLHSPPGTEEECECIDSCFSWLLPVG